MKLQELKNPLSEASYPGNIGMIEMFQFFSRASSSQKTEMKKLLDAKQFKQAWSFLQKVLGVTLHDLD